MDRDRCQADTDETVPSFDVPDDALERAARAADMAALTWNFCTYNYYQCGPIGNQSYWHTKRGQLCLVTS